MAHSDGILKPLTLSIYCNEPHSLQLDNICSVSHTMEMALFSLALWMVCVLTAEVECIFELVCVQVLGNDLAHLLVILTIARQVLPISYTEEPVNVCNRAKQTEHQ